MARKQKKSGISFGKAIRWSIVFGALIGLYILAMFAFIWVVNSDLYGRMTETIVAPGIGDRSGSREIPTVRLILHRFLPDENAIEASIMIEVSDPLSGLVRDGKATLRADVHDGSSLQPFGIRNDVLLNADTARIEPGVAVGAVESTRFSLPAMSSVWGFPFDDLTVRPITYVRRDDYYTGQYRLEIQKAMAGRLMQVSHGNIPEIRLTRSPIEKIIVLTGSVIFLCLSGILIYRIFRAQALTTLEELFAVAGYIVAAAGFRDLLGLSRAAGASALEIVVIGVPLFFLASAVMVSFIRGQLRIRENRLKKQNSHS
jgi:hypothetical protein